MWRGEEIETSHHKGHEGDSKARSANQSLASTLFEDFNGRCAPGINLRVLRVSFVPFVLKRCLFLSNIPPDLLAGRGAGDLAEHRARHQPGTAGIVEIEQPADQLARRIQSGDHLLR